jgi:nitrite reductase (NADH) small subunit/3-phenylpropionate/trans-cinnamate dioxygenase ferredoxin subunit
MAEFEAVAAVDEIPEGQGRAFTVNGRRVAVFRREGVFYAINDACPHMGASLAKGHLEGTAVVCPWHAWSFCVTDGVWLDNPKSKIRTDSYQVRVLNDRIEVCVPEPPARG